MKRGYKKRIFTARTFAQELGYLIWRLPQVISLFTSGQAHGHLYEKIVMVVDAVNGCIYCSWLDAKLAMKRGMGDDEIRQMLNLQFHADAPERELLALLFAQHFAETGSRPDPEMTGQLFDFYGKSQASNILLAIRAATFGNLYFNTWGAVLSRFRGEPAENSQLIFELCYFVLNFIIILPFVIMRKLDKQTDWKRLNP